MTVVPPVLLKKRKRDETTVEEIRSALSAPDAIMRSDARALVEKWVAAHPENEMNDRRAEAMVSVHMTWTANDMIRV